LLVNGGRNCRLPLTPHGWLDWRINNVGARRIWIGSGKMGFVGFWIGAWRFWFRVLHGGLLLGGSMAHTALLHVSEHGSFYARKKSFSIVS